MWKKIIIGVVVAIAIAVVVRLEMRNRVVWNAVLQIDLNGSAQEKKSGTGAQPDTTPPAELSAGELHDIERGIDAARDDQRVGGMVVRIGKVDAGPTGLKEIAAHIIAFGKAGKPAVCILDEEDADNLANAIAVGCEKRIGEGADADDDVGEFFDGKFGDDNWSRVDLDAYLKQVRNVR